MEAWGWNVLSSQPHGNTGYMRPVSYEARRQLPRIKRDDGAAGVGGEQSVSAHYIFNKENQNERFFSDCLDF